MFPRVITFPRAVAIVGMLSLLSTTVVLGAEQPQSPRELLAAFSKSWRETDWRPQRGGRSAGYMRADDDDGWKSRMRAMQGLVRNGQDSIPLLLETLKTGDAPQRILAAQTLGYLGEAVPPEPLVASLKAETNPAVRLYLVDSLGMLGKGDAMDWNEFLKSETNRDVKRHVSYVQERKGKPLDARVVDALRKWDSEQMDTASVGKRAPDFVLDSARGKSIRLSDFRGKRAVVLVFIYGDT